MDTTNFDSKIFFDQLAAFASTLLSELLAKFDESDFSLIDHACYRVADLAAYEAFKLNFSSIGTLLSEALINGRPIATYKLRQKTPISPHFSIDVVELPAPRGDAGYQQGFEHIEVVTRVSLESFMARYPATVFRKHNLGAKINRDVSVNLTHGLVKFHEQSLEDIITHEQRLI